VRKNSNAGRSLVAFAVIGALLLIVGCSGGQSTVTRTTTTMATTTTTGECSRANTSTSIDYRCEPGHTLTDPTDAAIRAGHDIRVSVLTSRTPPDKPLTDDDINAAGANVVQLVSQDNFDLFSPSLHISFKPGNRAQAELHGLNGPADAATQVPPIVIVTGGNTTVCSSFDLGDDGTPVVNAPDTFSCR
jgi:hypothetical protein